MTSKIKVDNINKVSDDSNIIKKCGTTVTVGAASDGVRTGANNLQASDGGNLISQCGTTITLGASGDTINLASGASQTGFGRTGTVDWQTTPKTGDFTAVNGEGYFVNTTSGAVTMTMPSGSAGAIVSIQDYNKTFDSNALTITPASGEKINGGIADGDLIISTEGQGLTFVYVDATVGWKTVHENEFTGGGSSFIVATGGTITTSGNCKIHTFTGPGTFAVCAVAACAAQNVVSYLVVGGGGGSHSDNSGGGGGGGYREVKSPSTPYTASNLDGYPSAPNRITVTAASFPIQVGGGGAASPNPSAGSEDGTPSIFSTIVGAGGGAGECQEVAGRPGGSGGGSGSRCGSGGSGNTPPTSPAQGQNGGNGAPPAGGGGGGGGADSVGSNAPSGGGGNGGNGVATEITASPVTYSGGGGGGGGQPGGQPGGSAGSGGAGAGGPGTSAGTAGTANTGGGAGGGGQSGGGAAGGSGIVVIRYKFQ